MIIMSLPTFFTIIWKNVSFTYLWLIHLLIKLGKWKKQRKYQVWQRKECYAKNDWINFNWHTKLSTVFRLCMKTDLIQMLFHQLPRFSTNFIALFISFERERCRKSAFQCKEKTLTQKIQASWFNVSGKNSFKTQNDNILFLKTDCFNNGYGLNFFDQMHKIKFPETCANLKH